MAQFLASFPNSRVENRPATTSEVTSQVELPLSPAVVTVLAFANLNRTGLTLRNTSLTDQFLYTFPNPDGTAPTVAQIQADGKLVNPNEQTSIDTNQAVYAINIGTQAAIVVDVDEGSG